VRQAQRAALQQQVLVGRGDVQRARGEALAVFRMHGVVGAPVAQQFGQQAGVAADVLHDADGGGEGRRQRFADLQQGRHAAGGRADDDHVVIGTVHGGL
jgi:hypothetical protein